MSLVANLRSGLRSALRSGLNPSDAANPMAGVSRDAISGIYVPANATEWAIAMAAAGIGSGGPGSLWLMQEASGNLADSIGGVTLTQTGAGHLYQQAVSGWARLAVQTVDGTSGQKWINSTTANNPATTDTLLLAYLGVPAGIPAAARDVMVKATADDLRFNTTGKLRFTGGSSSDLTTDNRGTVIAAAIQVDNTNSVSACYTSSDKFVATYALPASGAFTGFGGQTTLASGMQYLMGAEFGGIAARLTSTQIKALLTTLGWAPSWS